MVYVAYAIDQHQMTPYTEIFEMNAPGVYVVNLLLGRIAGYTDFAFRVFDLGYLVSILALTAFSMARFGVSAALTSAACFGLVYLGEGSEMSFQREFLALLPLGGALTFTTRCRGLRQPLRLGLIGLCFGLAGTIRPHIVLGAIPVLAYEYIEDTAHSSKGSGRLAVLLRLAACMAAGMLLCFALAALWMAQAGWLSGFRRVAGGYWPLYARLGGTLDEVPAGQVIPEMMKGYRQVFLWRAFWLVPAAVAAYAVARDATLGSQQRRQFWLLMGLAAAYSVYPVVAGKFWTYHFLIFYYFLACTGAVSLWYVRSEQGWGRTLTLALPCALAMFLSFGSPATKDPPFPSRRRADEIASFLKTHLRPGDTVQPLDCVGGAVHGMLLARAKLATPFMYDFHFYHDVGRPYIQGLRRQFLDALRSSPPRFIVEITGYDKFAITSSRAKGDFAELRALISELYEKRVVQRDYVIHERIAPSHTDGLP